MIYLLLMKIFKELITPSNVDAISSPEDLLQYSYRKNIEANTRMRLTHGGRIIRVPEPMTRDF